MNIIMIFPNIVEGVKVLIFISIFDFEFLDITMIISIYFINNDNEYSLKKLLVNYREIPVKATHLQVIEDRDSQDRFLLGNFLIFKGYV